MPVRSPRWPFSRYGLHPMRDQAKGLGVYESAWQAVSPVPEVFRPEAAGGFFTKCGESAADYFGKARRYRNQIHYTRP